MNIDSILKGHGIGGGGGGIKKVQHIKVEMRNVSQLYLPIDTVDLDKTFIIVENEGCLANNTPDRNTVFARLETANVIQVNRFLALNEYTQVTVKIVEMNNVKVQRISTIMTETDTSVIVNIDEVDLSKSFMVFSYAGVNGQTTFYPAYNFTIGEFLDSTRLNFERTSSNGNIFIEAFVIEQK